jgi:hypothetical protein
VRLIVPSSGAAVAVKGIMITANTRNKEMRIIEYFIITSPDFLVVSLV